MLRLFALSLVVPSLCLAAETELVLLAGEERVLLVPGVARASVSEPKVAEAKVKDGEQVSVRGLSAGRAVLSVWTGKKGGAKSDFIVEVAGDASTASAPSKDVVEVTLGSPAVIDAPGVQRLSFADESVASGRLFDRNRVFLSGVRPGRTTLTFWDKDGKKATRQIKVVQKVNPFPWSLESGGTLRFDVRSDEIVELRSPGVISGRIVDGALELRALKSGTGDVLVHGPRGTVHFQISVL